MKAFFEYMNALDAAGFDDKFTRYVYLVTLEIVMLSSFNFAIYDEVLKEDYLLVSIVFFFLLLISLITILSRVCVMKERPGRNPVWELQDPDSDVKEDHENQPQTNFFRLIKSVRIYELMYMAGIFFMIAAVFLEGLSLLNDPSMKPKFHAAAIVLVGSGLYLMLLIYVAAGYPRPKPSIKYAYQPFDEFIRVPMTVFCPKVFLHLESNHLEFASVVFFALSVIYGKVNVMRMSEEEIERFEEATGFSEIHKAMDVGMYVASLIGIFLIASSVITAKKAAHLDLLLTLEKNWRWNMAAMAFLLQDKEFESLEELRDAYLEKSLRKNLTEAEEEAIRYIEMPLWKSKPPFTRNRESDRIPEAVQSTKSEDAQPSTSRSTQGPQPKEPQPSASSQRPLRVG